MKQIEMNYEEALEVFLAADASYGGGLSNHGPMAVEALVSMGAEEWIGPFVERYRTRLERPHGKVTAAPDGWQEWLRPRLTPLITNTANLLGHGLLRVAHAVRGLERSAAIGGPSELHLRELAAAVHYWESGGRGLAGPDALSGTMVVGDWANGLDRLSAEGRSEGMPTVNLGHAAETADFVARIAALAPSPDPAATFDALAIAAAEAVLRNEALAAFTLLHGATVSSMARVVLPHLDDRGARRLEASVAAFVGAALMAFDDGSSSADATIEEVAPPEPSQLVEMAAATGDEHTIKFADACVGVAARTGARLPLLALHRQITTPYDM